jgi:hypothetical protein
MSDPRRLKNKGCDETPPAEVYELETGDPLYFITDHQNRVAVYLHEFETGRKGDTDSRFIPFKGRPQLIRELAPVIYARYRRLAPATITNLMNSLRWWWRHFDRLDAMYPEAKPVEHVADITEIHYAQYAHLPYEQLPVHVIASIFFGVLDAARIRLSLSLPRGQELHPFQWTAICKPSRERTLIEFDAVKRMYEYLKHTCRDALFFFAHEDHLPTLDEMSALFTLFVLQTGWNLSTALSLNVAERRADGTLVCIETNPVNPDTSILRSFLADDEDDEGSTVKIHAPKARAGGVMQRAVSRNGPMLGAYGILVRVTKQTESLRRRLQAYLDELQRQLKQLLKDGAQGKRIDELRLEISALERERTSPWLFQAAGRGGSKKRPSTVAAGIGCLAGSTKSPLKGYAKEINLRLHPSEKPIPEDMSYRDLRDSFISWRWMTSHSWLDAMLAAGHTNRRSLIQYLKRKQIKERHRRQFIKVGDALWDTVRSTIPAERESPEPVPIFMAVVAAKVADVPEEQIRRWLAGKDLTYVGAGCLDFTHPPKSIAPDHKCGEGCRVQRCMLCPHAILLPASGPYLARRLVELRFGRRIMPEQAWQEGDYPDELLNTEAALTRFDSTEVAEWLRKWEEEIAKGTYNPVLTEGAYA